MKNQPSFHLEWSTEGAVLGTIDHDRTLAYIVYGSRDNDNCSQNQYLSLRKVNKLKKRIRL